MNDQLSDVRSALDAILSMAEYIEKECKSLRKVSEDRPIYSEYGVCITTVFVDPDNGNLTSLWSSFDMKTKKMDYRFKTESEELVEFIEDCKRSLNELFMSANSEILVQCLKI